MSALIPFLALDQACDQAQAWIHQHLSGAGLRVVQTFDLQAARLAYPDCPCPHHGTDQCDCQMVVLLVYGKVDKPATLVIHSQDGRTWLSLAEPSGKHSNQHVEEVVRRTLIPHPGKATSPAEATYESRSTS